MFIYRTVKLFYNSTCAVQRISVQYSYTRFTERWFSTSQTLCRPKIMRLSHNDACMRDFVYVFRVIHEGLTYPCSICGKQFLWKRNLARHMRNHRERESGNIHQCRDCGKIFSSRDCYNNHMKLSKKHVHESALRYDFSQ